MLELYSPTKAEKIIARNEDQMQEICKRFELPSACLKAILYQELIQMDALDLVADGFVRFYWWRYRVRKRLHRKRQEPLLTWGPFGKRDSSTGYGQIFAYVAIKAANFAAGQGIITYEELGLNVNHRLDGKNPEDLCRMWHLLEGDRRLNMALCVLNLISAGEELNGHTDFKRYTPDEFKLMFTRYNANVRHITGYGEKSYRNFLRYGGV